MFAQEDIRRTTLAYEVTNMKTLFHVISGGVLDGSLYWKCILSLALFV